MMTFAFFHNVPKYDLVSTRFKTPPESGGSSASLPKVPFQLRIFEDTHFATLLQYFNNHTIGATYT